MTFCLQCGHPIPPERERRNCFTCRPECKAAYSKWRRQERNQRVCKFCGRPKRRLSGAQRNTEQGDIVPEVLEKSIDLPETVGGSSEVVVRKGEFCDVADPGSSGRANPEGTTAELPRPLPMSKGHTTLVVV